MENELLAPGEKNIKDRIIICLDCCCLEQKKEPHGQVGTVSHSSKVWGIVLSGLDAIRSSDEGFMPRPGKQIQN